MNRTRAITPIKRRTANPIALAVLLATMGMSLPAARPGGDPSDTSIRAGDPRAAKIEELYGSRTIYVDQEENYRVRIKAGAYWPIVYQWDMGDGTKTFGNNVVQRYSYPGRYQVSVRVHNRYGADSTKFWVNVLNNLVVEERTASVRDRENANRASMNSASRSARSAVGSPDSQEAGYYSWVLETHLTRLAAENAVRTYSRLSPDRPRIFVDDAGPGSVAYRILIGKYNSEQSALAIKRELEETAGRPISLMWIRS